MIKQHILNRINYAGTTESYQFYHENGWHPSKRYTLQNINIIIKSIFLRHLDTPVDPQELLYICSIADSTASHRILVKPIYKQSVSFSFSTPDLGQSPTSESTRKKRKLKYIY